MTLAENVFILYTASLLSMSFCFYHLIICHLALSWLNMHASLICGSLSRSQHCACYLVTSVFLFLDWNLSRTNVIAPNTIINKGRPYPETSPFKSWIIRTWSLCDSMDHRIRQWYSNWWRPNLSSKRCTFSKCNKGKYF